MGACPDVALNVAAEAVGDARSDYREDTEVAERFAVGVDIERGYVSRLPAVGDVEDRFVGRERQPVWTV